MKKGEAQANTSSQSPRLPVAKCLYLPCGVAAWVHSQHLNCTKTNQYMSIVVNTGFLGSACVSGEILRVVGKLCTSLSNSSLLRA